MNDVKTQPKAAVSRPALTFRRLCSWIFVALLVATTAALRTPVMDHYVRGLVVGTLLIGAFTGLVYLVGMFGAHPRALYPAFFFLGLAVVWSVLANKPPDVGAFRRIYVKQLRAYVGTQYAWGGETRSGIDCSGLARTAFWQAMLKEGLREMNPRLLGPNLWKFWWRDLSGSDMVKGRYGYLRTIGQVRKIAGSDEFDLLPGDVAVIGSGAHVLIYVGGNRWVEANPDDGKVVINAAFTDSVRPYFNTRATFMRWRILEEEPENTESH